MEVIIFIFIIGCFFGSFFNVLIDRLPVSESPWIGRSRCDHCKHLLSPIDLIPIFSFLFLGGKCRYCHKKLSWQYPIIEIATGILFVLIFLYTFKGIKLSISHNSIFNFQFLILNENFKFQISNLLIYISLLVIFSSLLVIFIADLKTQIIPDELVVAFFAGTLIYNSVANINWLNAILTAIISAAFLYSIEIFSNLTLKKSGMGMGDIKFAIPMGLFLGFPAIILAFYVAFLTGAVLSIILVMSHFKKFKSQIAFGPFLIIGTVISFTWGNVITTWYQNLFH